MTGFTGVETWICRCLSSELRQKSMHGNR